ncbi:MAG: hypothetical protein AAB303_07170 [Chloroflexota bacterium]
MLELPSFQGVERCLIEADTIRDKKRPTLLTASGQRVEDWGASQAKREVA